jgi:hypothetical protein
MKMRKASENSNCTYRMIETRIRIATEIEAKAKQDGPAGKLHLSWELDQELPHAVDELAEDRRPFARSGHAPVVDPIHELEAETAEQYEEHTNQARGSMARSKAASAVAMQWQ